MRKFEVVEYFVKEGYTSVKFSGSKKACEVEAKKLTETNIWNGIGFRVQPKEQA
jgi:superfamily II RNA helicase